MTWCALILKWAYVSESPQFRDFNLNIMKYMWYAFFTYPFFSLWYDEVYLEVCVELWWVIFPEHRVAVLLLRKNLWDWQFTVTASCWWPTRVRAKPSLWLWWWWYNSGGSKSEKITTGPDYCSSSTLYNGTYTLIEFSRRKLASR